MQGAPLPGVTISASDQVLQVLQLNKDHQATVKTEIEQLESKLAALDKLLVRATSQVQICWKSTGHLRPPQKSTTKTTSSLKWEGTSLFLGLQRSRLQ